MKTNTSCKRLGQLGAQLGRREMPVTPKFRWACHDAGLFQPRIELERSKEKKWTKMSARWWVGSNFLPPLPILLSWSCRWRIGHPHYSPRTVCRDIWYKPNIFSSDRWAGRRWTAIERPKTSPGSDSATWSSRDRKSSLLVSWSRWQSCMQLSTDIFSVYPVQTARPLRRYRTAHFDHWEIWEMFWSRIHCS